MLSDTCTRCLPEGRGAVQVSEAQDRTGDPSVAKDASSG
jgi:hypothetical protein